MVKLDGDLNGDFLEDSCGFNGDLVGLMGIS